MEDAQIDLRQVTGRVKWFDPGKGFGFILDTEGGPDILLHANVLRNFGQGSVADNAGITVTVQVTPRGAQAVEVLAIAPPEGEAMRPAPIEDLGDSDPAEIAALPLEPARVKWFDKVKGFGFANVFGRPEDVFIHIEVLRRSGFADLGPGEAVCLRVIEGKRGRMAAQVVSWETALREVR
ncbi:cold shock domain-containing protein [Paenirhodobacter sp. CAU 1674]|uniref:cold-shock protein n=1 Tax=Paenirhodobacter sp. CAU 1674 TaxID=3032596 RepID=UPI0023DA3CAB|nr:cold shock domain-containing protein [Paenirhodobacter sp. CAU 1674]MDF2139963.1 cold shock domain-containing protein [Paenirhodobacter sp. CAU 1674]